MLLASPERIIISGGVMQRITLFPRVRSRMQALLNGYINLPQLTSADGVEHYLQPSAWGNSAGLVGALTLATRALDAPSSAASRLDSANAFRRRSTRAQRLVAGTVSDP